MREEGGERREEEVVVTHLLWQRPWRAILCVEQRGGKISTHSLSTHN